MEVVCLQSIDLYHQHLLEMQLLLYHKQSELKMREREREMEKEGEIEGGRETEKRRKYRQTDSETDSSVTCYNMLFHNDYDRYKVHCTSLLPLINDTCNKGNK